MKICPNCRRTYDDDALNFCLDDGSVLTFATPDAAPTVVMDYPRPTSSAPPAGPTNWDARNQQAYSMQPEKRSSKTWVWVVGILAILILVCGGGFAAIFVYVASIANSNTNVARSSTSSNNAKANANATARTPDRNSSWDGSGDAHAVDLSDWVKDPTPALETEWEDDQFFMTSKQKGYYYVLVAKDAEFSTSAISRVIVRNPDDHPVELGYGLVFLSDTTPLLNDYAFLIDTSKKKYRVVRHELEKETTITAWTGSNSIKDGGQPNLLESRFKGDKIELYINDALVTSISNKQGPKKGVPGLYVGDGARIGFKKLEVVK
jgi:hypothetical protein